MISLGPFTIPSSLTTVFSGIKECFFSSGVPPIEDNSLAEENNEGQIQLNSIIHEMNLRATNISYGAGVAIGRAIGTRDDRFNGRAPTTGLESPSLGKKLSDSIQGFLGATKRVFFTGIEMVTSTWEYYSTKAEADEAIVKDDQAKIRQLVRRSNEYTKFYLHERLKERQEKNVILEHALDRVYSILSENIDDAMRKARQCNMPFMILIGENHESLRSALIEALTLHIASEKFALKTLLTESFFMKYYQEQTLFVERFNNFELVPPKIIEVLANQLQLKKVLMDYASCGHFVSNGLATEPEECDDIEDLYRTPHYPGSKLGIKKRDEVMVDVAIKANVNDTVAIVGVAHLSGMLKETPLTDIYHVLPIDTYLDYALSNHYLDGLDDEVLQPQIEFPVEAPGIFPHSKMVFQRAQEAHERGRRRIQGEHYTKKTQRMCELGDRIQKQEEPFDYSVLATGSVFVVLLAKSFIDRNKPKKCRQIPSS